MVSRLRPPLPRLPPPNPSSSSLLFSIGSTIIHRRHYLRRASIDAGENNLPSPRRNKPRRGKLPSPEREDFVREGELTGETSHAKETPRRAEDGVELQSSFSGLSGGVQCFHT
ncbi:hypothetical protein Droror1_Dr00007157 [Drosera rotundifolia]